jgi:hypothetical protein
MLPLLALTTSSMPMNCVIGVGSLTAEQLSRPPPSTSDNTVLLTYYRSACQTLLSKQRAAP